MARFAAGRLTRGEISRTLSQNMGATTQPVPGFVVAEREKEARSLASNLVSEPVESALGALVCRNRRESSVIDGNPANRGRRWKRAKS
jgi:hypothetical protein